jgi:hypothetical protein
MREWRERARLAIQALAKAKHGQREAILCEIAGGVNLNTVRREIKVLAFFDLLERATPDVAVRLQDASFNSMEVLARWHDFDSHGAVGAARKLASGEYSLSSLVSAMREAKRRLQVPFPEDLRTRIRPYVKRRIQQLFGEPFDVTELPLPHPNRPPIDFLFTARSPRNAENVAALVVGPYANAETYSKRRHDELLRAMGMAWIFDNVVVLLPAAGELFDYQEALKQYRGVSRKTTSLNVHVLRLKVP